MTDSYDAPLDFPLPPASFSFLVESIMMQTQMQLGLFPMDEQEPDFEPNLPIASHSIDLLAMLQEKTRGHLSVDEQRLLENGLTELRFRYVQVSEELKKQQSPQAVPEAAGKPLIITTGGGKGMKSE